MHWKSVKIKIKYICKCRIIENLLNGINENNFFLILLFNEYWAILIDSNILLLILFGFINTSKYNCCINIKRVLSNSFFFFNYYKKNKKKCSAQPRYFVYVFDGEKNSHFRYYIRYVYWSLQRNRKGYANICMYDFLSTVYNAAHRRILYNSSEFKKKKEREIKKQCSQYVFKRKRGN